MLGLGFLAGTRSFQSVRTKMAIVRSAAARPRPRKSYLRWPKAACASRSVVGLPIGCAIDWSRRSRKFDEKSLATTRSVAQQGPPRAAEPASAQSPGSSVGMWTPGGASPLRPLLLLHLPPVGIPAPVAAAGSQTAASPWTPASTTAIAPCGLSRKPPTAATATSAPLVEEGARELEQERRARAGG
jgi:hypothetical protein